MLTQLVQKMNNFLHIVFSSKLKAGSEFSVFFYKLWTKIVLIYKLIEERMTLSRILVKFCEETKIL